jgi:hypothetical protein
VCALLSIALRLSSSVLHAQSIHMKTLLSKYAEAVLADLIKRMKQRELQNQQEEEED